MSSLDHPSIARVAEALRAAGQDAAADGIRVLPADVRTAAQAAAAVGVEVGAIANSLLLRADDAPLLALKSGAHRADLALLADIVGAASVAMAEPGFVRQHTGQVIGGVAPVGHPQRLPTLVDTHLQTYTVVWAAAGHPKAVYPTSFDELVTLTAGTPCGM
jgi:prolyl-tRNA editing enzyme YbaK/EbsC (Cys-tRNA(Pro) deacylase)